MTGDERQRVIAGVRAKWRRYLGEEVTEELLVAVIGETLDYMLAHVNTVGDIRAAFSQTAQPSTPVERLAFGEGQLLLIFPPDRDD